MAAQVRAPLLVEVTISDLLPDGRGVAHVDGKAVFVHGALPGERATVRITRRRRKYDEAVVAELLSHSPDRVEPRCPHVLQCSGCSLQHLSPVAQVATKQKVLAENFVRIGKVKPQRWLEPLCGDPWGYRRKGRLSVKWVEKKQKVLVGFREPDARFVADLAECHTLIEPVGMRIDALSQLLGQLDAREFIAQIEFAAGDDDIVLVLRNLRPLGPRDRDLLVDFARQTGLAIMLQPKGPDSVVPLWPERVDLSYSLPDSDVELAFQPLDFIQVNAAINQRMVAQALQLLDLQGDEHVLDLFCGLGNFTLPMARHAAQVTGVEGDAGLLLRAGENAARNGIANVDYALADLFEDHRDAAWARADYDKILIDPPRSGAAEVLEYLPNKHCRRVVYVSCHPASLARDAGVLVNQHGFTLAAAGVMDMFAHTAHVESIAVFER